MVRAYPPINANTSLVFMGQQAHKDQCIKTDIILLFEYNDYLKKGEHKKGQLLAVCSVCSNCAVVSRIQIISKTQSLPACILSHYTLGAKTIGNREKF